MGASTALSLTWRGHEVALFESRGLNHKQGSSHGRSRIVRRTYADPFYTEIMVEGYHLWKRLEARSGLPIFNEVGMLYFGEEGSHDLQAAHQALIDLAVDHRIVHHTNVGEVFAGLRLNSGEIGLFTPEAGWVHADRAVRTSVEWAIAEGAEWMPFEADPFALAKSFDAVVLCAGPWISRFVPDLKTEVTLQTVGYFEHKLPDAPVYIEDGPHLFYGFPSESWSGDQVKVAMHTGGPPANLEEEDRQPQQEHLDMLRGFLERRFGAKEPVLRESLTCLYTRTKDEDFRWGVTDGNVFWVSPCSGHGFKFAPWIGERMSDFVEGKRKMSEWPRFVAPS